MQQKAFSDLDYRLLGHQSEPLKTEKLKMHKDQRSLSHVYSCASCGQSLFLFDLTV
jgi:hypothetical protein